MTGTQPDDQSLIAMAGILVTGQSLEKTLRQILELACAALPGGHDGGITLLATEGPGTAVATSDAALRVDTSQYTAETSGPCLDAYRRQQILRIDSTAADQRWPEFSATAATEGFGSTLSVPLVVGGDGLGALNLYCHDEQGFRPADEQLAATLGSAAAIALANARTYWKTARLADQLQQTLNSHGVIDQATGILIAQHSCSAEHAFHLLAATAQRHRLTVTDVATDLIQRTSHQKTSP